MKRGKIIIAFVGATVLISGCSSMKVVSDYDKGSRFTNYRSYGIEQDIANDRSSALVFNELNQSRIELAMERNLAGRGMHRSDQPDVLVVYSFATDSRTNYTTSATYTDMGGLWRGRYGSGTGMGTSQSTTRQYNMVEGQLMISLIDAESEKLIWYGAVSKEITGNGKKAEKRINEAVDRIFRSFPINEGMHHNGSGQGIAANR